MLLGSSLADLQLCLELCDLLLCFLSVLHEKLKM